VAPLSYLGKLSMRVLKKLRGGLKNGVAGGNDAVGSDAVRSGEGRRLRKGVETMQPVQTHQQVRQIPHLKHTVRYR